MLDNNPAAINIVASAGKLYQLHSNGGLWQYTGMPCSGSICPGWQLLINDGTGRIAADGSDLYELNLTPTPSTRQRICVECR
jgi:hypothetical protein